MCESTIVLFGSSCLAGTNIWIWKYSGAVKSNIGHLEGASGIASIIKTIMVLERGIIPPNTNFTEANPRIDTDSLHIKVCYVHPHDKRTAS
jgi:3-oxoacyl-(acyl-carrier-protein) synthase